VNEIAANLDGTGLCVGIVRSRFNERVGLAMLASCRARLLELGVAGEAITVFTVPGALEVPLALRPGRHELLLYGTRLADVREHGTFPARRYALDVRGDDEER